MLVLMYDNKKVILFVRQNNPIAMTIYIRILHVIE